MYKYCTRKCALSPPSPPQEKKKAWKNNEKFGNLQIGGTFPDVPSSSTSIPINTCKYGTHFYSL